MKRVSPTLYARALDEVIHKNPHAANIHLKRFVALVKHNGHGATFPEIVREFEKVTRERAGKKIIRVESARKLPPHSLAAIQNSFAPHQFDFEEKINPELVAGVRLTENNERQYDGSLARMLNKIFQA